MTTYKTLTAGAKLFSGTIAKPAARTAVDCKIPATTRIPTGRASISLQVSKTEAVSSFCQKIADLRAYGVPMSRTMNETKSVVLSW